MHRLKRTVVTGLLAALAIAVAAPAPASAALVDVGDFFDIFNVKTGDVLDEQPGADVCLRIPLTTVRVVVSGVFHQYADSECTIEAPQQVLGGGRAIGGLWYKVT